MTEVRIDGERMLVTHATTAADDSETLEFWRGPGRTERDLVVAVTFFEDPTRQFLVHVPGESTASAVVEAIDYTRRWIAGDPPQAGPT